VLIRSMITGPLVKISFDQGQQVKKGGLVSITASTSRLDQ
jgi:multidrug efflux pump subunit AcrA (membrane-fusion protein)